MPQASCSPPARSMLTLLSFPRKRRAEALVQAASHGAAGSHLLRLVGFLTRLQGVGARPGWGFPGLHGPEMERSCYRVEFTVCMSADQSESWPGACVSWPVPGLP